MLSMSTQPRVLLQNVFVLFTILVAQFFPLFNVSDGFEDNPWQRAIFKENRLHILLFFRGMIYLPARSRWVAGINAPTFFVFRSEKKCEISLLRPVIQRWRELFPWPLRNLVLGDQISFVFTQNRSLLNGNWSKNAFTFSHWFSDFQSVGRKKVRMFGWLQPLWATKSAKRQKCVSNICLYNHGFYFHDKRTGHTFFKIWW